MALCLTHVPTEKTIGRSTFLVCRDCGERLAPEATEPELEELDKGVLVGFEPGIDDYDLELDFEPGIDEDYDDDVHESGFVEITERQTIVVTNDGDAVIIGPMLGVDLPLTEQEQADWGAGEVDD